MTNTKQTDWRIDHTAGRPILVYQNCSVIEAEQAEYVLRLIEADRQQRGGDDFSGVQPPMRYIAGVNVDVLRRAALAIKKGKSNG